MAKFLCGFCKQAYLDDKGECPNGCTARFADAWNKKAENTPERREVLAEKLKRAVQVTAANMWGTQKGLKPKKHGHETKTTDTSTDKPTDNSSGTGGFTCPNCGVTGGHAEWCPWND